MDFKSLRIIFALLMPLLWVDGVLATPCADTDYDLRSQAEVDALGQTGCTSVTGDLQITNSYDIANLDGLANLTSVGGQLDIYDNAALTNVNGLANITRVGGSLFINDNDALINLDGLTSLTSVGGFLTIESNDALTNLDGLANITNLRADMYIRNNFTLTNCQLVAPILGWPDGPPEDAVAGDIYIAQNEVGCNSIGEILVSYTERLERLKRLPEIVALGLLNNIQGFLGSSSEDTAKETPPAAREAPAKDLEQAKPIPTLPTLTLLILSGLMALFGIRRLRAV